MYTATEITLNRIVLFLSYPRFSKSFFKGSGIFLNSIRVTNVLCHTSNTMQYLCETTQIVTQQQTISSV